MNENIVTVKGRQVQKHDIEVNWIKAGNAANPFIPLKGEIIIYDSEIDNEGNILELPEGREIAYNYARIKIGDGIHNISELPFSFEPFIDALDSDIKALREDTYTKAEVDALISQAIAQLRDELLPLISSSAQQAAEEIINNGEW